LRTARQRAPDRRSAGSTAVVAFALAIGTTRLARRGAVVKRLASVETLGSTSQVCTGKTGTLTLNQMTARELRMAGHGSPCPARATRRRDGSARRTGPRCPRR
jgi:Ca2+-transporting ATPase